MNNLELARAIIRCARSIFTTMTNDNDIDSTLSYLATNYYWGPAHAALVAFEETA